MLPVRPLVIYMVALPWGRAGAAVNPRRLRNCMEPNWYHDRDLTTEQADYLDGLESLRVEQPIVWALINGLQTSRSIAKRINWPHDWVVLGLRKYKKEGLVYDLEGRRSVIWQLAEDETEHYDYKRWVAVQGMPGGLFNPHETNENDD